MGPWYWLFHVLGVPTWVAQRLWMGTLLFAAGTGVRYLARLLGVAVWGQLAAALIYMLTPFIIDYLARTSAILMPWAGLGWLVGFIVLAVRRGGLALPGAVRPRRRPDRGRERHVHPAVGLAPALWLVSPGCLEGGAVARRRAHGAEGRSACSALVVSLWWVAGLWAEGAYGINVLRYTETFPTVTLDLARPPRSSAGLGYWYFYGNDKIQPWTLASSSYMSHSLGVLVSFAVPALALGAPRSSAGATARSACSSIVVGVVLAVGAYPLDDPTPLGRSSGPSARTRRSGSRCARPTASSRSSSSGSPCSLGRRGERAAPVAAGRVRWSPRSSSACSPA